MLALYPLKSSLRISFRMSSRARPARGPRSAFCWSFNVELRVGVSPSFERGCRGRSTDGICASGSGQQEVDAFRRRGGAEAPWGRTRRCYLDERTESTSATLLFTTHLAHIQVTVGSVWPLAHQVKALADAQRFNRAPEFVKVADDFIRPKNFDWLSRIAKIDSNNWDSRVASRLDIGL